MVVFAGIITLVFWLTRPAGQPSTTISPAGQNVLPVANPVSTNTASTTATATTILLAAPGGTIEAKNFIADPATAKDPINAGYYYLGYHVNEGFPDATATDDPPYIIEYINATQYFNIALLHEPIGQVRSEMEQYLIEHLEITQNEMCRLNYTVSVPDRVNSQFSGVNLGFSFCPGATVLPQ